MNPLGGDRSPEQLAIARHHLRFGWWALLFFLSFGLVLEAMHGLKIGWYLDVGNEVRRLMWTLGHAHGALLSLVNMGFAVAVLVLPARNPRWQSIASRCLLGATVLLPGGFFLGGIVVYGGDPGLGVLPSPIGGTLLLIAAFLTAYGIAPSDELESHD